MDGHTIWRVHRIEGHWIEGHRIDATALRYFCLFCAGPARVAIMIMFNVVGVF